jgi:hypothetical protein
MHDRLDPLQVELANAPLDKQGERAGRETSSPRLSRQEDRDLSELGIPRLGTADVAGADQAGGPSIDDPERDRPSGPPGLLGGGDVLECAASGTVENVAPLARARHLALWRRARAPPELLEAPRDGLDLDTILDIGHYARHAQQIVARLD